MDYFYLTARGVREEKTSSVLLFVYLLELYLTCYSLRSRKFIILPLFTEIKGMFVSVYSQEVISKTDEKGLLRLMKSLIANDMT